MLYLRTLVLAAALLPVSAFAQDAAERVDTGPDVKDVAMTPIQDLNLASDPIPAVLVEAEAAPYSSEGLATCRDIGDAIGALTAVLGPDVDVEGDEDGLSVGKVAKGAVGSLIPFRGVVREITGAADKQRAFEAAILAGAVRRGYLKGLGETKGCPYPARPAFAGEIASEDSDDKD